jgi:hypothetical protein
MSHSKMRTLTALGGATALIVTLAACGSGDDSGGVAVAARRSTC